MALLCGLKQVFVLSGSLKWVGEVLCKGPFRSYSQGVWCIRNDTVFECTCVLLNSFYVTFSFQPEA